MKWIGFWKRRTKPRRKERLLSRRTLLRRGGWLGSLGVLLGGGLAGGARAATDESSAFSDSIGDFFQKQYQEMTRDEIQEAIGRIQRKAKRRYDVDIQVGDAPPPPGVVFGVCAQPVALHGRAGVRGGVRPGKQPEPFPAGAVHPRGGAAERLPGPS